MREIAGQYLEGLTRANVRLMRTSPVPPLYSSGVRWSLGDITPLPLAHTIARRGRGACGPLAAYRAAELRMQGENARAVVRPSASGVPGRWHAVVMRGDGRIEDPSARLARGAHVLGFGLGGLLKTGLKVASAAGVPGAGAVSTGLDVYGALKGKGGAAGAAGAPAGAELPDLAVPPMRGHVILRLRSPGPGPVHAVLVVPLCDGGKMSVSRPGASRRKAAERTLNAARAILRSPLMHAMVPAHARMAIEAGAALLRTGAGRELAASLKAVGQGKAKVAIVGALERGMSGRDALRAGQRAANPYARVIVGLGRIARMCA